TPGLICPLATSRTFIASAPYFRLRVKVTSSAQEEEAGTGDASGAGVSTGAGVAAGSPVSPAGIRLPSMGARPPGRATAVAVMINQRQIARRFFIFETALTLPGCRIVAPSLGDLTASHARKPCTPVPSYMGPGSVARQMFSGDMAESRRRTERDTGAGIVAAHDACHVVACGIEAGAGMASGVGSPGVVVGLGVGIRAEIADHELDGL